MARHILGKLGKSIRQLSIYQWHSWQLSHLKIKDKLNLVFGVLIGVTFVVMGVNYWSSRQITLNIKRTQELRMPIALSSSQAQTNLLTMLSNVRGYLVTGNSEFRLKYQEARHEFESNLSQMEQLFQEWNVPLQIEQLDTLRSLYKVWSELPPHLFNLKDNRLQSQPAFRLWEQQAKILSLEVFSLIAEMIIEQEGTAASEMNIHLLQEMVEFQGYFSLVVADIQSYISTQEQQYRYDYTSHYRKCKQNLDDLVKKSRFLMKSQEIKLDQIGKNVNKIEQINNEIFAVLASDRYREDLYLYQSQAEPIAEQMLTILSYTVATQQQQLTSELEAGVSNLRSTQIQTLIGVCFSLGFAAIMSVVLRKKIADPIQRLIQATSEVQAGNLKIKARVESTDEIGILAKTFNQMTNSLNQSLHALEDYNKNLEHLVEQRTEEIRIKNDELQTTLLNLKETQIHLIQAEKMSSLGQMIAGIAHEINNPVSFIHGNLVPLMEYSQDLLSLIEAYYQEESEFLQKLEAIDFDYIKEDFPKLIEAMYIGTTRISEIILSLKNFSRLDQAELKEANIHEGLESTLLILQHRFKSAANQGKEIDLQKDYGELPLVECYPGQLNQVFMNILANGIEVLESQPDQKCSPRTLALTTKYQPENESVLITIRDNGPGIDSTIVHRVFDPFFTTKPVGKGTGLGLSISYKIIVEHHHGVLKCDSEVGKGATFYIEIPVKQTPDMREIETLSEQYLSVN